MIKAQSRRVDWTYECKQPRVFVLQNALQEFVSKHHRSAELHRLPDRVYIRDENAFFNDTRLGKKEKKRLGVASTLRKSLCFSLPGTELSVDFFKEQVGHAARFCVCIQITCV